MAFQALASNKLRATLTMLGTIIGVTCVVALWNIGQSGRAYMNNTMEAIGQNLIFVQPRYSVDENDRNQQRNRWRPMSQRDVVAIQENCPSLDAASPVHQNRVNVTNGSKARQCFQQHWL